MEPEDNELKTPPQNQNPAPVMDVTAPPAPSGPTSAPAQNVDPVEAAFDESAPQPEAAPEPDLAEVSKPTSTTSKKSGGNSAAITVAVIVMIALAGLATFAYIQQNK